MKPRISAHRRSTAASLLIAASLTLATRATAAGGNWNVDADGNWSTPSNWNPAAVPGTAAGDVVDITFDITTEDRTVTLDTAARLGTLNIGDPDGSNAYTLALTSGTLTFDNGTSAAQLNKTPGSNTATITPPLALNSNLTINNSSTGNLNLDGIISNGSGGAKAITIASTGTGVTTFNGANPFSGGLTIKQGTLYGTTSPQAFGSAPILLGDTSGTANATLRADNRNFTNPITVQGGSTGNTLTLVAHGDTGTTTFSGGITLQRDLVADSLDGTLIINTTALTGSSTLTIANSSLLSDLRLHRVALNVPNPGFTGSIDILPGGTLRVGNVTALNFDNIVKVRPGGLFELNAAPFTIAGLNDEAGSGGTVSTVGQNRTLAVGGSGTYSFNGTITDYLLNEVLRTIALTKSGAGTQELGGTNSYSGTTLLNGGVLKLNSTAALPGGIEAAGGTSPLLFRNGGILGLTAASGDFKRPIQGLTPGPEQVGWTNPDNGGRGGFAAFGGDRSVNFGGEAELITWAPTAGILGATLILGHATADSKITIVNPIDLGGFPRTVRVNDGSAAVDGEFSGTISGGGELKKDGPGTLELTANNPYGAATLVMAGTLRIKGLHSGSNNNVTISDGAELVLEPTGQLAFAPAGNGTSNKITGPGTAALNGTLLFKLGNADLTDGNSWTIIDAPGTTTNLAGIASTNPALIWNENPVGIWKATSGTHTWTFSESSGTLTLSIGDSINFDSWASTNGIPGASFSGDHDGDGIDNGTEYAIGGNPTAFTPAAQLVLSGGNYTLTYPKGAQAAADPQITYVFETSPDLDEWTEVAPTTQSAAAVSYTLSGSEGKKFVRLKIKRTVP